MAILRLKFKTTYDSGVLTFATFLGRGRFGPTFGNVTAVADFKQDAVFGRRQSGDDVVSQPLDEDMDTPIARLEQSSQAP